MTDTTDSPKQLGDNIKDAAIQAAVIAYSAAAGLDFEQELADLKQQLRDCADTIDARINGGGLLLEQLLEAKIRRLEEEQRALHVRIAETKHTAAAAAVANIVADHISDTFDPHGFFVYLLWGEDPDTPLYVGQSANILSRLGSHMGDPEKRRLTTRVQLIRCDSAETMMATEWRLITHYLHQ